MDKMSHSHHQASHLQGVSAKWEGSFPPDLLQLSEGSTASPRRDSEPEGAIVKYFPTLFHSPPIVRMAACHLVFP